MAYPLTLWYPNTSDFLSFFLSAKMSIISICVGHKGEMRWERVFEFMLIKISCMQKLCEFCHGFFQARFMSLLRIKLKQSSHNQICRCRKLGNSLKHAGLAFHGSWAMSPPVAWHYWCCVSSRGDRRGSPFQRGLAHPWPLSHPCALGWKRLCSPQASAGKSVRGTGAALLTFQGYVRKILATNSIWNIVLEVRMTFFIIVPGPRGRFPIKRRLFISV